MLPTAKVYKIDYDFIISNYLDKSLWKKSWNLFVYKEHIFTLRLCSINTQDDEIVFEIKKNNFYDWERVYYNIKNTSVRILMRQINGAIFKLMCSYELSEIRNTSGYKAIASARETERDRLRDIAINFLDEEGITNTDIRDVYIDNYVCNNEKTGIRLQNYLDYYKYNLTTDMYLVFCEITKDVSRLASVKNAIHNKENLYTIELEVHDYIDNLEEGEFDDELYNELQSI